MSLIFRSILLVVSIGTFCYIIWKIRKSQVQIADTSFWVVFSFVLVVIAVRPQFVSFMTRMLQMEAPVNFVFLTVIFLLLVQLFLLSIKVSRLESRLQELAGEIALAEFDQKCRQRMEDRIKNKEEKGIPVVIKGKDGQNA